MYHPRLGVCWGRGGKRLSASTRFFFRRLELLSVSQQLESASWIRSLNASDRHNGCFFFLVIPKRSFSAVVIIACLIKRIVADKNKRRQAGAAIQKNIILASLQIPTKISCHVPSQMEKWPIQRSSCIFISS